MYSADFPNIFSGQKTKLLKDRDAIINNLILVLSSYKRTLLGDPFFGTELNKYLFNQNTVVITDIVIDQIYGAIVTYVPQIRLERNDITIKREKTTVYAEINYRYLNEQDSNLLEIKLLEE